jgi:hypothetical protein
MQLMLGVLKKKLKHDLNHAVEELDLPQATTASQILKDRSPDVTLLREGRRAAVRRFAVDLGGIDNRDGDRHLYVEAGGQKHTQWLAPVSRAASLYPSL